ncbi:Protein OCTOPUS-like - like 1 [Theobroma cacao]|nr:Protein OCTOPUS-like - like 1 [Theobroma cacao]
MGLSEADHGCKKHPHHQEKQGVCPSCLRERLSRLCSASHKEVSRVSPSCSTSLPFSPAYFSSASSSKSASPARHSLHKPHGPVVMGSLSFMVKVGNGLKKSRSIAFVPRNLDDEEVKDGRKKKGFWSKLLGFKGKKDVLTHSTSMRMIERVK